MFHKILLGFLVCMLAGAPVASAYADTTVSQPLSNEQLVTIIQKGSAWLARAQEKDGHFRYEYLPYEGKYRKDDNIVRQAGALFALGEIERADSGSTYKFEKQFTAGMSYFEQITVEGTYNGKTFRCVRAEREPSCKLGTTALVLVAMIDFVDEYPKYEKKYRPLMDDYAAYIMVMKKPAAGFRYYFNPSRTTQKEDESSFSNGEAFLALARYDAKYPSVATQKVIADTFTVLQKTPNDANMYLWVMAGLKDLEKRGHQDAYVAYAKQFTTWRLLDNAKYADSTRNRCAYIEGLASAHSVLAGQISAPDLANITTTIDAMLTSTAPLQVLKTDVLRYVLGADGKGVFVRLTDPKRADGGFLTGTHAGELTQRIDFTQHCLSSYVQTLVDIRGKSL